MIRPLRDLLVIRPDKPPGIIGAIHIPDMGTTANKSPCVCTVIAAGPTTLMTKAGDKVMVPAYGSHPAGDEVTIGGILHTIIRERDIHGIVLS